MLDSLHATVHSLHATVHSLHATVHSLHATVVLIPHNFPCGRGRLSVHMAITRIAELFLLCCLSVFVSRTESMIERKRFYLCACLYDC